MCEGLWGPNIRGVAAKSPPTTVTQSTGEQFWMVGRPRRAYSRHDHPANRKPCRGSYDPIATIAQCLPMFQSSRLTTDSPTFQGCAIMATAAVEEEEEGEEGGGAPLSRPALAGVTLAGLPTLTVRAHPERLSALVMRLEISAPFLGA